MSLETTKQEFRVVYSYFPCLTDKFGMEAPSLDRKLIRGMEEDIGNVQRMAWEKVEGSSRSTPIFYIREAEAVFKHLMEWCGHDFSWFKLVWELDNKGFYGICLLTDMERFAKVAGYDIEQNQILQWIWQFNSRFPNFRVKHALHEHGKQKLAFADDKTEKVAGYILVPVSRFRLLAKDSLYRRTAKLHLSIANSGG